MAQTSIDYKCDSLENSECCYLKELNGVLCQCQLVDLMPSPPQITLFTLQQLKMTVGPVHSGFLCFSNFLSHLGALPLHRAFMFHAESLKVSTCL